MGDGVAAAAPGLLDGQLGDQRPAQGGEQRIPQPVDGVGLDRRKDVVAGELLPGIDQHAVHRPQLERLAADHLEVLPRLPQVDRKRHHLGLVALLDPLQHHTGV